MFNERSMLECLASFGETKNQLKQTIMDPQRALYGAC